ncbi:hypothetical protein FRC10_009265 [Ceratobasidium sp. 414]|nr:hypothetical protein FRC10_009265 [Ceratobasidium sp. 414]
MPKAATTKTTRAPKEPKEPKGSPPTHTSVPFSWLTCTIFAEVKEKSPSLYQLFMKDRLPEYKAEHPDVSHKDAFKNVALEWKDSDRNPNKGREAKPKREPKPKVDKEAAPKKTKKKPAAKQASSDVEEEEEEAADDDASSN